MLRAIEKFWKEEEGAALVEYGLLVALIALAAVAGMMALGSGAQTCFQGIATSLKNAVAG